MVKSMTAFGRHRAIISGSPFIVEIHSVNRKGLEVGIQVPKDMMVAEFFIRKKVAGSAKRGSIVVKVFPDEGMKRESTLEVFKKTYGMLSEIAGALDPSYRVSLRDVLDAVYRGNVLTVSSGDNLESELEKALEGALVEWDRMKLQEGKVLSEDILGRLDAMKSSLRRIEKKKEGSTTKYKDKLLEKLAEVKQLLDEDRERVLREVVLYVDRFDITEEIVRLESHILQVKNALTTQEDISVGRTVDFVIQEMLREANTISSKASDLEVIQEAIFIKSEIERIREQVQNLE